MAHNQTRRLGLAAGTILICFGCGFAAQSAANLEGASSGAAGLLENSVSEAISAAKEVGTQIKETGETARVASQERAPLRIEGAVAILEETEIGKGTRDITIVDDSYYRGVVKGLRFPLGGEVVYAFQVRDVRQTVKILDRKAYKKHLIQNVKETLLWSLWEESLLSSIMGKKEIKRAKQFADVATEVFTREARYVEVGFTLGAGQHFVRPAGSYPEIEWYLLGK